MHIVIGACHRHREGEKLRKVTLAAFIRGAMDRARKSWALPMDDYSDAPPPSPSVGIEMKPQPNAPEFTARVQ